MSNQLAEIIHSAICDESLEDCLEWRGKCVKAAEAISEAGAVEWATEHVAQGSRTIEIHPCDSEADAQGAIAYYGGRILSRIAGPWERAE